MSSRPWLRYALSTVFALTLTVSPAEASTQTYDLVVYGGTAAGTVTAIAAARQGLHVVLLEPGNHLGGMLTGGLSATDIGNPAVIGGIAREFFERTAKAYHKDELARPMDWHFEPHVGEQVLNSMLRETGVEIHLHERIKDSHAVRLQNKQVLSITTADGQTWSGRIFVDCSYEGDLMAQAGVRYTWGRESADEYHESLAGVREKTPAHQFTFPVSPFDASGHLLPEVDPGPLAKPGSADRKVQAYNLRVILTQDKKDLVPFPRPAHYNPHQFALLARYLQAFVQRNGRSPSFNEVTMPGDIPGDKADFNNRGPFSTDYIGKSWSYPNATYQQRQKIWQDHLQYTKSFFYFLAHDPAVPADLQKEVNTWGLPRDEFADTGHWPFQLYVREGRRMIGEYVMHQADIQTERTKPDSIGMGSYNSDSHNVQRIATPDGRVENEGDVQVPVQPYEIPYRSILPKPDEAENLLVPVCFSATHVAYSSLRMEPQYMILGQAAGTAAVLALREKVHIQDIDIAALQKKLLTDKAVLSMPAE
jgi:hypothetical protein